MSVRELLGAMGRVGDGTLPAVVASAFSRRHCFMCTDGTSPCDTCEGTGKVRSSVPDAPKAEEEFSTCPQCGGLAFQPCPFCMGSGWHFRDQVPAELRRAVLIRQLRHAEKDMARLRSLRGASDPDEARKLPLAKRRMLAAWLFHLQARLASLAAVETGDDGRDRPARFGATIAAVEKVLEALHGR